jgi:hypothetical protein
VGTASTAPSCSDRRVNRQAPAHSSTVIGALTIAPVQTITARLRCAHSAQYRGDAASPRILPVMHPVRSPGGIMAVRKFKVSYSFTARELVGVMHVASPGGSLSYRRLVRPLRSPQTRKRFGRTRGYQIGELFYTIRFERGISTDTYRSLHVKTHDRPTGAIGREELL